MNAPILDEWELLGTEWRADSRPVPATAAVLERLLRRVRRRSWQRAAVLALEVVLTGAVVWWSMNQLPQEGIEAWVLRLGVLLFTALVWVFGLWNGRHGWRAEGALPSDFLALSRRRLTEGQRSIRFVRIILGVSTAAFAPWLVARAVNVAIAGREWATLGGFVLYLAAMLGWCAWYARWIARERAWLDALARDLA